jgi:hypothetical protein
MFINIFRPQDPSGILDTNLVIDGEWRQLDNGTAKDRSTGVLRCDPGPYVIDPGQVVRARADIDNSPQPPKLRPDRGIGFTEEHEQARSQVRSRIQPLGTGAGVEES